MKYVIIFSVILLVAAATIPMSDQGRSLAKRVGCKCAGGVDWGTFWFFAVNCYPKDVKCDKYPGGICCRPPKYEGETMF
uniref:Type III potassium channel toxin protein n=1 Tax=Anemonia sulcata TaxID=6108 RepID=A0A0S1M1A7_ANESU|nr:type III potassium channel toxin protein [Anemonia sulcata]